MDNLKKKIEELGLTPELYEACLSDAYAKANRIIDIDWQEIIDKYGLNIHYDTLRKATQTVFGGAFVSEYFKAKHAEEKSEDRYLKEMRAERQAIRMEKQKVFDERKELNKSLREQARAENDLKYLERIISERGVRSMPAHDTPTISSDNDLVICLSDFHIGAKNDNRFGKYDSDIAAERLNLYYQKILEVQQAHHSENAYIFFLGDLINGEIHFTTQLENRESLIEQVQHCAEELSIFAHALSLTFKNVYINGVAGNHSRTSFKDQVLRGNRLDNLIPWYMKAELKHIQNIHFIDGDNYDPTIGHVKIRKQDYLLVHGDWDSYSESGVSKLVMMIGYKPTAIFMGHMHHNSFDDIADVKLIRSGSFCGSGSDYCVSKRITGAPAQMVAVVDANGVKCCYPINLKTKDGE